jgi:hypothetical protein
VRVDSVVASERSLFLAMDALLASSIAYPAIQHFAQPLVVNRIERDEPEYPSDAEALNDVREANPLGA